MTEKSLLQGLRWERLKPTVLFLNKGIIFEIRKQKQNQERRPEAKLADWLRGQVLRQTTVAINYES